MNPVADIPLAAQATAIARGWSGLLLDLALIEGPMLLALWKARAPLRKWLVSPLVAAPLIVVAGMGIAAVSPVLRMAGADTLLQVTLGAGISVACGYLAGRKLGARTTTSAVHMRGALVAGPDAAPQPRAIESPNAGVVTLAGIPVRAHDEAKHFKFIGTTGTGKSTAIQEVLETALRRGDRAVVADPDGGYLRRLRAPLRGDVILNPFEPESVRWDLFGEIADDYDVEQLARSLVPDHEGADRSWRGYARTFLTAVTRQAHGAGVRDVAELYRLLLIANPVELRQLVAGTPAQPFLEEHNMRMFESIRSVTASAVSALDYIGRQKSRPFSVRRWVRDGLPGQDKGGVLFIPYRAGQIAALRSTISAWMRLAIFETMNGTEEDQRLWFVVDELDALGQIDGLKDALARLRKFGGRCVLGFQSVSQVSSTYGAGEAQTIVENCGNTLIFRCSASEHGGTARFASQLIGNRQIARPTVSRSWRATDVLPSTTRSDHQQIEPAIMDSEIEQLPDLHGYLKFASTPYWRRVALEPAARGSVESMALPAAPVPGAHSADTAASRYCADARKAWQAGRICGSERLAGRKGGAGQRRHSEHVRGCGGPQGD